MRYPLITFLVTVISMFIVGCKSKNKANLHSINQIKHQIDSIVVPLSKDGMLNGTVLVAKDGKIIYNKSFGISSSEKQPLTTNDKFSIGSIYKEIPAISIMQLQETGKLKLNDKLNTFLPDLPEWSKTITIQHLLQYTSGLPRINWGNHKVINDEVLMADLKTINSLQFEPGSNYNYTNYSPFLLSKIVERVTGKGIVDYVSSTILTPVGMTTTGFNSLFPYKDRASMAIAFNQNGVEDKPPFQIASPIFLFSTTATDWFMFLKNLHAHKLISEASLKTLAKTADLQIEDMESPLGQVVFKNSKIDKHTHHGSSGNYECLASYANGNAIIIFTNQKHKNVYDIKVAIENVLAN